MADGQADVRVDAPATGERSALEVFLADRDMGCPNCGYNLRGLRHEACPECRQGLVLYLGLQNPKTGLLIGAVAGLMCGLVPAMILLVLIINYGDGPELIPLVIWAIATVACLGTAFWQIARGRARRRFFSQSRAGAVMITVGCWLGSLAALVVLIVLIATTLQI